MGNPLLTAYPFFYVGSVEASIYELLDLRRRRHIERTQTTQSLLSIPPIPFLPIPSTPPSRPLTPPPPSPPFHPSPPYKFITSSHTPSPVLSPLGLFPFSSSFLTFSLEACQRAPPHPLPVLPPFAFLPFSLAEYVELAPAAHRDASKVPS